MALAAIEYVLYLFNLAAWAFLALGNTPPPPRFVVHFSKRWRVNLALSYLHGKVGEVLATPKFVLSGHSQLAICCLEQSLVLVLKRFHPQIASMFIGCLGLF